MKFLITLLLNSSFLLASEHCIFRPDKIDKAIDIIDTIQDYYEPQYGLKSDQRIKEFYTLHPLAQKALKKMYQIDNNYSSSMYELLGYLDDLELTWAKLKVASGKDLLVMSYGVGGGNGGYHYFEIDQYESLKLVASSFDGDMEYCLKSYYQ